MLAIIYVFIPFVLSKVYVYSPDDLRTELGNTALPSSLANFGNPPYGSVITGKVFVPTEESQRRGCGPINPIN